MQIMRRLGYTIIEFYGNLNVTKLSKFKHKGVEVQSLHMEGCKRSNLQTQGYKSCGCMYL